MKKIILFLLIFCGISNAQYTPHRIMISKTRGLRALPAGDSGQVLTQLDSSSDPSWQTVSGGGSLDTTKTYHWAPQNYLASDSTAWQINAFDGQNLYIFPLIDTPSFPSLNKYSEFSSGVGISTSIFISDTSAAVSFSAKNNNKAGTYVYISDDVSGAVQISSDDIVYFSSGGGSLTISYADTITQNIHFKLPPNDGVAGQVLSTDGNGNLTWVNHYWDEAYLKKILY